jgi:hypothetical protein
MKGETIISFFCYKFHMKLCQKKMYPLMRFWHVEFVAK